MKKNKFYLYLNILNILLCISMYIALFVFFITCCIVENGIEPYCLIVLYILTKIFLLPLLFNTFEKFFPNLILSQMTKELKTNRSNRKIALLIALAYDIAMMLYFSLHDIIEHNFEWMSIPAYEMITLGGVCIFYIALFVVWKIQDKLKLLQNS